MVIPTLDKSKTPRGWCYPIGAEAITRALEGVPAREFVCLRFLYSNYAWTRNPRSRASTSLLSLRYTSPEITAMERFWMLDIYAVRAEEKPVLAPPLHDQVLPRLRDWLAAPRTAVWREGRHSFYASYNWNTDQTHFSED